MKKFILPSLKLSFLLLLICSVIYPLLVAGIGKFSPGKGKGVAIERNGKVIGFENEGQKFTADNYFWSRPSGVSYNAAGSGGSNKGPTNPEYLKEVEARIDTFLIHNPGIKKEDIPADMVTASGSGLDPHISPKSALIQIKRIAKARMISEDQLNVLVESNIEKPYLSFLGTERVNVLKLNIALDKFKK